MGDSVSAGFVFPELAIPDNHCLQESLGPIIVVFKNPSANTNILPRALFVNIENGVIKCYHRVCGSSRLRGAGLVGPRLDWRRASGL